MSFLFELDPREEASTHLIGRVGAMLRQAIETRKGQGDASQADLARRIDVNPSVITKCLSGFRNMTLKTLSDIVWALGGEIEIKIRLKPLSQRADQGAMPTSAAMSYQANQANTSPQSSQIEARQNAAVANVVEFCHAD